MAPLFFTAGANMAGSGLTAVSIALTAFIANTVLPLMDTTICHTALTGDHINPVNALLFGQIATVFCLIPEAFNWFTALFVYLATTPTLSAPPPIFSLSPAPPRSSVVPALVWSVIEYGSGTASESPTPPGPIFTAADCLSSQENYWARSHEFPLFSLAPDLVPGPCNQIAVYVGSETPSMDSFMTLVGYPLALVAGMMALTALACTLEDRVQLSGYVKRAARRVWSTVCALTPILVSAGVALVDRDMDTISAGVLAQAVLEQVFNLPEAPGLAHAILSWVHTRLLRLRISSFSTRVAPATVISHRLPLASATVRLDGPHLLELGLRGFDKELVIVFHLQGNALASPPSAKRLPLTSGERMVRDAVDLAEELMWMVKKQCRNTNWGLCLCCTTLAVCCAVVVQSMPWWMLVGTGIYACTRRFWNDIIGWVWELIPLAVPSEKAEGTKEPGATPTVETPTSEKTTEAAEAPGKAKKARKAHKKKRSPKPTPDTDPFAAADTMAFHRQATASFLPGSGPFKARPTTIANGDRSFFSSTPSTRRDRTFPSATFARKDCPFPCSKPAPRTPACPSSASRSSVATQLDLRSSDSTSCETSSPIVTPEDGTTPSRDVPAGQPRSASARTEVECVAYHYEDSVHCVPLDKGKGRESDTVGRSSSKREYAHEAAQTSSWDHSVVSNVMPRSILARQPAERKALLRVVEDARRNGSIPYKKRLDVRIRELMKSEDNVDDFNRRRRFMNRVPAPPPRSPSTSPVRSRKHSRSRSRSRSSSRSSSSSGREGSSSPVSHRRPRGRASAPSPSRSSPPARGRAPSPSRSPPLDRGRAPSPSRPPPLDRSRAPSPSRRPARGRRRTSAPVPSAPARYHAAAPLPRFAEGDLRVSELQPPVPGNQGLNIVGMHGPAVGVIVPLTYQFQIPAFSFGEPLIDVEMAEPMDEDEWSQGCAQMELVFEVDLISSVQMGVEECVRSSSDRRPLLSRISPPVPHITRNPSREVDRPVATGSNLQPILPRVPSTSRNPPVVVEERVRTSPVVRPEFTRIAPIRNLPVIIEEHVRPVVRPGFTRICPPTRRNLSVELDLERVATGSNRQPLLSRMGPLDLYPVSRGSGRGRGRGRT